MVLNPAFFKEGLYRPAIKVTPFFSKQFLGSLGSNEIGGLKVADLPALYSLPINTPVGSIYHVNSENANYQLGAASTAITGEFVQGADTVEVNAVYTKRGTSGGKDYYNQLGQANSTSNYCIVWGSLGVFGTGWGIKGAGAVLDYYSLDAVSRPDQVSAWVSINLDTAPNVTSATTGQLGAGIKIENVISKVNGSLNGRNVYSDVLVSGPDVYWNPGHVSWENMNGLVNAEDLAFPFLGAPAPPVDRDDIANLANWVIV